MTEKPDLFGIEKDDEGDGTEPYVILQLLPAEGWKVVFKDLTTEDEHATRMLSLACFALVEVVPPTEGSLPMRGVRPMVADEHGQIGDVESFGDEFICLVPPGRDPQSCIDYVRDVDADEEDE